MQISGRTGVLINRMSVLVSTESARAGTWAILDDATGAELIHPATKASLKKFEIFAQDGSLLVDDSVCKLDPILGLVIPAANTEMLLANGQTMAIPPNEYYLHPQTG